MDDGDPAGDGLPPDAYGADLEPGSADGAGVGENEAPLGASPLEVHVPGSLDGDPLRDSWEAGSDDQPAHPGAAGPADPDPADSSGLSDPADESAAVADPDAPVPDIDGPHDHAGGPNSGDRADPIQLDIDDTAAGSDEAPAADQPDPSGPPDALQAPLLGLTPPEVTEHSLWALGVAAPDFDAALTRLGIADAELGLDGRTVGIAMGEVGVDAVVEHAGLDDLAALVGQGRQVLLTGPPDAPVLQLTDIDLAGGSCVVEDVATGARHVVGVDVVESSWAAAGYQVVTGSASASSTDVPADVPPAVPGRGGASVAVIQAVIAAWQ